MGKTTEEKERRADIGKKNNQQIFFIVFWHTICFILFIKRLNSRLIGNNQLSPIFMRCHPPRSPAVSPPSSVGDFFPLDAFAGVSWFKYNFNPLSKV